MRRASGRDDPRRGPSCLVASLSPSAPAPRRGPSYGRAARRGSTTRRPAGGGVAPPRRGPRGVAGVRGFLGDPAAGRVAEEDGPAEARAPGAVAVGGGGGGATGQPPLERRVGPRLAEDGDVVVGEPA